MTKRTRSLEEAATLRGASVISAPPLAELGDGSPTIGLLAWLTKEHGRHRLDNVFVGDKLLERLKTAEKTFKGSVDKGALLDANICLLDTSEGFRLIGDGLFLVRPSS